MPEGWKFDVQLEFNGVDPNGDVPPDEILAHSDVHDDIELERRNDRWDVNIYRNDSLCALQGFVEFEDAFAYFSTRLGAQR